MIRAHLVDASVYIFRAYFSIPKSLKSPAGVQINAVRGFAGFLLDLLEREDASHALLAFDRSLTTSFRNEIYPPYKAQRDLPPEALEAQIGTCERLGRALGIETRDHERYEADDLIASLGASLLAGDPPVDQVVIVSSDKDLAQLVDARTQLLDFARDQRFDADAVLAKLGVRPEQVPDYLGLAGDSVDNIPGVPGVGAKTAAGLLDHFDHLEDLWDRLDEVATLPIRGAKSLAAKLVKHRESAELSKRLATVVLDHDLGLDLDALAIGGPTDDFEPLMAELGFGRLADRARALFDARRL